MRKHNLVFIDTETTGLNFDIHEIIELGGLVVSQAGVLEGKPHFEVLEEFNFKIKPEHIELANPTALKVNHYNEADWIDAISLAEALKHLTAIAKDGIMVGHNIAFDFCFIQKAFQTTKIENTMHYHKLDTISIAYAKLHGNDDIDRFSLHSLCEYFSIENEREHSALADAKATFELYQKLMEL